MADDKSTQTIIIKRIKKGGHASHGGAWKIAYADFVTAMMAFFLLLWLLSSVSQEQLEGISNYFAPVSVSSTQSGGGDILGGATIAVEGSAQTSTSRDSVTVDLPPPKAGTGGEGLGGVEEATPTPSPEEVEEERLRQEEEEQFEEAKEELEKAIESVPQLQELAESLLIDNTPEGLRIQLLDKDGLSMFPSGSAKMYEHTRRILKLVSSVIVKMPQRLSISGHTDSVPFTTGNGYGNWELSADRANSARRELVGFNIPEERVSRVVGKAATDPFLVDDPKNAQNRRLSIVLLRGTGREKPDGKEPAKKKRKLKVRETLPGLSSIRQRQEKEGLEGLKKQKTKPKSPKKKVVAKPKPKGIELNLGAEQKTPALPGLEAIRKSQIKKGLEKSEKVPAQTGGTKGEDVQPQLETLKPLITKREKIETTEGETLPGLETIRQRQIKKGLEKSEKGPAQTGGTKREDVQPQLEILKPLITKREKIETTEGEGLPGLEAIRKRQIKKGLEKSEKIPAQTGGTKGETVQPQREPLKPLITKREKIETTEGETLPGLSAIRKRQLEKEKAAPK